MAIIGGQTNLRKWHTWVGLIIILPSLILAITGIYLIESPQPKQALIAATVCPDGAWIAISSKGLIGTATNQRTLPFSFKAVSAIACTSTTIDMALTHGPIFSAPRKSMHWNQIPRSFDGAIRSIHRTPNELVVSTNQGIWRYQHQSWQPIQQFSPTVAQRIHALHAGWFNGGSFSRLWSITGVFWVGLSLSGLWIFIRMVKNLYKKKSEI